MNNKTLILLGAILLGLIAIAVAPKIFPQSGTKNIDQKNISVNLSDYTEATTSKILLKQGEIENSLTRENNEWFINGEKADQTKVASLFLDFEKTEIQKLASKNDANQNKFNVTPENGITLILTKNAEEQEFYVGKSGPSYGTFYIRKKGIKNVYLMKSELRAKLSWDASEWKPKAENSEENAETNKDEAVPGMK